MPMSLAFGRIRKEFSVIYSKVSSSQVVAEAHTFNPSTEKVEAGESL